MCTNCALDVDVQSEFGEKLFGMISGGMLGLMISIGHRTGLFDSMHQRDASTSQEIAEAAGLNERYVREWLGAMVTGGIITISEDGDHFHLPNEHATVLCREFGSENMGIMAQFLSVLGGVEGDIVECFHNGGGVPYDRFPSFHDVMAEESGNTVVGNLESFILPLVPGLAEKLHSGISVLDAGCGRGRALLKMAKLYPCSEFTGYDLSEDAIRNAQAEAEKENLTNITFQVRDLSSFHKDAPESAFDFVTTFDSVHDQARPDHLLAGIRRTLKPGGVYLMQDIKAASRIQDNLENPLAPVLYTISCMHCMTVSLAQGGMGLGAAWGRELATSMLSEAGFDSIEVNELDYDPMNDYYVCK